MWKSNQWETIEAPYISILQNQYKLPEVAKRVIIIAFYSLQRCMFHIIKQPHMLQWNRDTLQELIKLVSTSSVHRSTNKII